MNSLIYVTGDLHGNIDISKLNQKRFPQNKHLTKEDYVIVAGDFGLIWHNKNDELYWRKWLSKKNFTTLFIDGNHENFNILDQYPVEYWNGGKVHRINESIIHLMRGQIFTINGMKFFTFGGASSHDREYRKENYSWWSRELPNRMEYEEGIDNLSKHNWNVDIVLTHTCPASLIEKLEHFTNRKINKDPLIHYLETIKQRISYKQWYF
nr:metallophosphoesterase [Paenibacillus sp. OAS669]